MQRSLRENYPQRPTVVVLKFFGGRGSQSHPVPIITVEHLSHWGSLTIRNDSKMKAPTWKRPNLMIWDKEVLWFSITWGVIKGLMAILELLRNFWPIDQSMWLTVLAQWTYRLILLNIFRTPEKNPSGCVLSCSIMLSDKVWERRQFVRTDCHRWLSQTCYNQLCHRSLSCTFCHRQRGWLGFFFLFK